MEGELERQELYWEGRVHVAQQGTTVEEKAATGELFAGLSFAVLADITFHPEKDDLVEHLGTQ